MPDAVSAKLEWSISWSDIDEMRNGSIMTMEMDQLNGLKTLAKTETVPAEDYGVCLVVRHLVL